MATDKKAPTKKATKAAPRKRAARKSAPKKAAPKKRAPRKTASVAVSKKTTPKTTPKTSSARKAPTKVAQSKVAKEQASRKRTRTIVLTALTIVIVSGASITLGYSDTGEIDIDKALAERASVRVEKSDDGTERVTVPVKDVSAKTANGGLVGAGVPPQKKAPTPEPSETATSSDAFPETTSTTSEEIISDEISTSTDSSNASSTTE